jgi:putative hemolysin
MEILIVLILILVNGIFSMSEIALVSAKKFKLENAAKRGNANARKALDLANSPGTFLSTVQIGITLIGILTGIFSGENITSDIQEFVNMIPVLQPYAHSIAVAVVVIVITYFSIVFGELIPKRIGLVFPESIAMIMAVPMKIISVITSPFIWLLTITNDFFFKIFRIQSSESKITEEEIKSIIQESTEGGEIQEIEQDIVERVFALGDRKVAGLMTHRMDLVWLDLDDSLDIIRQKIANNPHSIYPVAAGSIDNVTGVLFVKDLFVRSVVEESFNLKDHIKQAVFVSENMPAYTLLERFKTKRIHFAMITDEYGVLQGMITMDDLLDALVGDSTELHHEDEYTIIQREDGTWLADAQYSFYEFLSHFDLADLAKTDHTFNTIAGFIIHQLKHIPETGEKIYWRNFEFEIIDMDATRIDKVLITVKE